MIEKLDSKMECVELSVFEKKAECLDFEAARKLNSKINELVDAVNELQESQNTYWTDIAEIKKELQTPAKNVQPDYVTTTYPTDGHTKEYYGQNGASIVTDPPLPAGYVITIREPEAKGGNNE